MAAEVPHPISHRQFVEQLKQPAATPLEESPSPEVPPAFAHFSQAILPEAPQKTARERQRELRDERVHVLFEQGLPPWKISGELHMTQSGVSSSLKRLRETGDLPPRPAYQHSKRNNS